ncbi:MAG: carbonic anhydrase [Dokdonella sp.]
MSKRPIARGLSRREVLGLGAAVVAASVLSPFATAQEPPVVSANSPDEALNLLKQGNARYVANQSRCNDYSVDRASRAVGQAPHAAILSCSDSRVAPEFAFDQGPGELFVVRVAGNFVTTDGLASLEYGAKVLGTKLIVVLGHSGCGAVNATLQVLREHTTLPGHIPALVRAMKPGITPVLKDTGHEMAARAVIANVNYNVQRLANAGPVLAPMVRDGKLKVVGGVYDLASGRITFV